MQNKVIFSAFNDNDADYNGQITYNHLIVNKGDGMDISKGIFTSPVKGIYSFAFMATTGADTSDTNIFVRKNGELEIQIVDCSDSSYKNLSGSWLLVLNQGDQVDLYVSGGHLGGPGNNYKWYTIFSGQ